MSAQPVAATVALAAKPSKSRAARPKPKAKKLTAAEERAARLAREAGEIASGAGLKSAYLRQDGAAFLAEFKVSRSGQTVRVERKGQEEPGEFKLPALKRFVAKGGEPEVSKVMRTLCSGSRLYGRKAACFCIAALAQDEVA
jgi:pyruvate/2-oxoglutarate dehydrogenase complex dihydrolipoamide acyltransferase (E2) component